MSRLLASCAAILGALSLAPWGQTPAAWGQTPVAWGQTPGDASRARVLVDAVALDRHGMPVQDLKAEDLEVWIGHFRVPIESLTPVTSSSEDRAGRLLVLVMDDVTLPFTMISRARDVARRFVTRMSPGDRMAIVMLNGATMESTDDRSRLLGAIDRYTVRATGVNRIDRLGEHVL